MEPWIAPVTPLDTPLDEPVELDPSAIPDIEHYELDDIPLFHLPMAGSTILTIQFRVGRADEPATRGGMTHLAEHLVLTSVSDALDHSNGTTEPFRVTFVLRGTPATASRFLRDVCAAIEKPPLGRMYEEANVLRTEAAGKQGMGMSLRLAWYRTGYQGIGKSGLPELFLRKPDEAVLRQWIAEHFVAGNAVIWIAGELPDDLVVSLPPGPRLPPPEIRWIPEFDTPTMVVEDAPGVGASFFVERSTAMSTAFRTLDRKLRLALRVTRGLAYDIGAEYIPMGPRHALATVWATCLPNAVVDVQQVLLEAIDDVGARGPSDEDLAEQYQRMVREMADPMAVPGRLDAHARDVLMGREPTPLATVMDEQWRLRSDEVAEAFRTARESMLFLLPTWGKDPQRPFKPYPGVTLAAMGRGRTFELQAAKKAAPWSRAPAPRLTVGDVGVAIDAKDGTRLVGVRWDECVALIQDPGMRTLVCLDGGALTVAAEDWKSGGDALKMVDRLAPRELVLPPES